MKNIIPFFLTLIASTSLNAQIKVNALDFADAGDTVRVSVATTANANEMATSGANVTWDFSDLTPNVQRIENFDAPNTFQSPFNFLFNGNNTSFGKINATFSNINLMVITLEKAYDFIKKTSEHYHQIGIGLTINGNAIPMMYNYKDVVHIFPVEFEDEDSCDFQFGAGLPSMGYYGQTGKRVNFADSWGSITTPYGTFEALRIVSKVDITDTIYIEQFGFGTKFTRPTSYQYKWFAKTQKLPILEIIGSYQGNNFIPTSVVYRDIYRPEVNQISTKENELLSKVQIFPNPTKGAIQIYSPYVISSYRLLDISGKDVMAGNSNQENLTLSLENFPTGMYIFFGQTEKGMIIQKIAKE